MLDIITKKIKPIRYYFERLLFQKSDSLKHLNEIKNTFEGKPMLIIGNGPSLNKTPLDDFIDIPAIGMNKIDMLYKKVKWRPSLVVCVNGIVMKQNKEYFNKTGIKTYLGYKAKYLGVGKNNPNVNYFMEKPSIDISTHITKGMGAGGTVTYTALQMAYYLGANPVILFGVDHSFATEKNTRPNQIVKRETEDNNHFDPNYFQKGTYWGVPNLDKSERGYMEAKRMFEEDGRKVYDATIGGKLDIFPKISVDEAKQLLNVK